MGNEGSDSEYNALQRLLDAFPSAPLELIASAYIQSCSDQERAAEIIAFSLDGISRNDISSGATDVSGNQTYGKSLKPAVNAKGSSHGRPRVRSRGPCLPTLEEYFPASPEKNAWVEPLSQRLLQGDVSLQQNWQSAKSEETHLAVCSDEFPSLEMKASDKKGQRSCCSSHSSRGTSRASAAFGLASSGRTGDKSSHGSLIKASATTDANSSEQLKRSKQQVVKAAEVLLWPTEPEVSLLSMLGDDVNLGIEAIRDVLGYYKGDIHKSFDVLQQINSSSSTSNDQAHEEESSLGTLSRTNSGLFECFEEVPAVGSNVEGRGISSMNKADNSCTLQTYYAFEKAILEHENSSMKWVVECLCKKYPHADMATLLEVLRATNFNLNDAEKMLQEAGLHEGTAGSEERKDLCQLAKTILESLFSEPEEVNIDCEEKCKKNIRRHMKEKAGEIVEVPRWKAVTSNELDMLEGDEGMEQRKASDKMLNKVMKCSETLIAEMQGEKSSYGDWDDYERHQTSAKQHWKTMQSYLTAATAAYASSDFQKGELLTEKGNKYKQLYLEAKERANKFLLEVKSRQCESDFFLDLREQHIPEALQLLRLHLKSFSSIPSCHTFTVVTGCPENPRSGHKKIKLEVVGYLEKKGYKWVETNAFCLQIQMRETKQMEGMRTGCEMLSK